MAVWDTLKTQQEWREYLQKLVRTDPNAMKQACICIYNNQTDREKCDGATHEDNGVGFTSWDAPELTKIAEKLIQHQWLSSEEYHLLQMKMPKYWKQLMVISKRNMAKKAKEKAEAEEKQKAAEEAEHKRAVEEHFRMVFEQQRECLENGNSCDYGICDECPLKDGRYHQMSLFESAMEGKSNEI